jgi:glucoamylase
MYGSSFFILSASHRPLVEGVALAETLGADCEGCAVAIPQILCFMDSFWTGHYVNANLNAEYKRSGIDASTLLSSIHTYDPEAGCTNSTFQPCSSRALANHKVVTDSFRPLYGINAVIPQGQAVAVGKYPEDKHFGGNPWYIATLAAAEQLYLARLQWLDQGSLTVDDTSLPFFRALLPWIQKGTYSSIHDSIGHFDSILSAVYDYADGYMNVVQKYTPADGVLTERFNKNNGAPVSDPDGTWDGGWSDEERSAHVLSTATDRRNGIKGPTWGEPLNNVVMPSQCYCHAYVTFTLRVDTPGRAFVVGDVPELGNGNLTLARELEFQTSSTYYDDYSKWIDVPASTLITYHYFQSPVVEPDGQIEEDDLIRELMTGDCGSNTHVYHVFGDP